MKIPSIKELLAAIEKWYEGKEVKTFSEDDNNENGDFTMLVEFAKHREKPHWTAKVARVLVTFYMTNWKWIWGVIVIPVLAALRAIKFSL